jgi:hypothetical protein
MRVCNKCKINKEYSEFSKCKTRKNGYEYKCKLCYNQYKKEYFQKNKINYNELSKDYFYKRKKNDSLFKLICNIRSLISKSIKNKGYNKNTKTFNYLGCTFEEFKVHLEKQFTEGMNWDNQGKWHLDHIKPISLAKTEKEVIELNHYTNFQPLWAKDNLRKSNKYEEFR